MLFKIEINEWMSAVHWSVVGLSIDRSYWSAYSLGDGADPGVGPALQSGLNEHGLDAPTDVLIEHNHDDGEHA